MSQKENNYESENKYDRKKSSKYDVGDLIEKHLIRTYKNNPLPIPTTFFIVEKRKREDKKGTYWAYDIFYPHNNFIDENVTLVDNKIFKYVKVA